MTTPLREQCNIFPHYFGANDAGAVRTIRKAPGRSILRIQMTMMAERVLTSSESIEINFTIGYAPIGGLPVQEFFDLAFVLDHTAIEAQWTLFTAYSSGWPVEEGTMTVFITRRSARPEDPDIDLGVKDTILTWVQRIGD